MYSVQPAAWRPSRMRGQTVRWIRWFVVACRVATAIEWAIQTAGFRRRLRAMPTPILAIPGEESKPGRCRRVGPWVSRAPGWDWPRGLEPAGAWMSSAGDVCERSGLAGRTAPQPKSCPSCLRFQLKIGLIVLPLNIHATDQVTGRIGLDSQGLAHLER